MRQITNLTLSALVVLHGDLSTLKLVRFIACGVGKLPTNFDISGSFCYPFMGQHLSDAPRGIATLTFDFGGHGACW